MLSSERAIIPLLKWFGTPDGELACIKIPNNMNATHNNAHPVQMVVVNDHRFAVEERNGGISFNLTQMAKPYGKKKRPVEWLRGYEAKSYIEALTKVGKSTSPDLVEVRHGGKIGEAGTWTTDYRIAVRFAQWLDVDFAIAVDELIWKLITKQAMVIQPKNGVYPVYLEGKWVYPYAEAVRAVGGPKESSATRRKRKFPQHFVKGYGRNFITAHLFDLLQSYNAYKQAQLTLNFDA